jgi:hypothetical protein
VTDGHRPRSVPRIPTALAGGLVVVAIIQLVQGGLSEWGREFAFRDLEGYLDGTRRFLATGSPYDPLAVVGAWQLSSHSFIHPPTALPLFLPFLVLPAFLWWVIPIGITAYAVRRLSPAPWSWPLMALGLVWVRSTGSLLAGNTDMWAMAFVAAGAVWGWPAALLVVKPTFAPLAAVASGRRSFWLAGVAIGAVSLAMAGLWLEYAAVIRNSGLSLAYSLLNLPLVAIPAVAWFARRDRPSVLEVAGLWVRHRFESSRVVGRLA